MSALAIRVPCTSSKTLCMTSSTGTLDRDYSSHLCRHSRSCPSVTTGLLSGSTCLASPSWVWPQWGCSALLSVAACSTLATLRTLAHLDLLGPCFFITTPVCSLMENRFCWACFRETLGRSFRSWKRGWNFCLMPLAIHSTSC